jgi:hypothetical protein
MKKENLCWNCGKYTITNKDYRQDDFGGMNKVLSCKYCVQLNDVWHYRVRTEKLNPKQVLLEG